MSRSGLGTLWGKRQRLEQLSGGLRRIAELLDPESVEAATPELDAITERVARLAAGLGDLIEYGETDKLFIKPVEQATEDYITGRFG